MAKAIIALGSNLGDRREIIEKAVERITRALGPCLGRSGLIETAALIHPDDPSDWHPPFLNGIALFETEHEAVAILETLLEIEHDLGRTRGIDSKPWQPRLIDLDLIAVDAEIIESNTLTLPHPRLHERRFVLEPLAELLPDWRHPVLKKTVREMLEHLSGA